MKIVGACASSIGSRRKENQDRIFFKVIKCGRKELAVGAVFDGIGGLDCGEVAAALLIQELTVWAEKLQNSKQAVISKKDGIDDVFAQFRDAVECWNESLYNYQKCHGVRTGATMSALLLMEDRYLILQAGDSRIYRFRQFFEQLTDDEVCYEDTDGHYVKKLTNYVGKHAHLQFLEYQGEVQPDDLFFFCSDGGYQHLLAADIEQLRQGKVKETVLKRELEALIQILIARGECDNLSIGACVCQSGGHMLFQKWKHMCRRHFVSRE